jgi:hypothetical protein
LARQEDKAVKIAVLLLLMSSGVEFLRLQNTGEVRIGTLTFTAQSKVDVRAGLIRTVVRATNRGRDVVQLPSAGDCPVALRVSRELGGAFVWDGTQHRGLCYGLERIIALGPMKSVEFAQTDSVRRIEFGRTQNTPYFFSAVLRVGGGLLQIPAGSGRVDR